MSWTYITDDPATLPPMDTPVFLLTGGGQCTLYERNDTDGDGWLWSMIYGAPYWHDGAWQLDDAETDDVIGVAWHPLPVPPTEAKP